MRTGSYDTLARFERPVRAAGPRGAGKGTWAEVITEWVNLEDKLPSRSENLDEGMSINSRPARLRLRNRYALTAGATKLTVGMRVVVGSLGLPDDPQPEDRRIMQIVSGPAIVRSTNDLEFMVTEYSTQGGAA